MSAGDKPYYHLPIPLPLSSFAQEKLGMLELNASGETALLAHGDVVLDDQCSITSIIDKNPPSILMNDSCVNVSATYFNLNSAISLGTSYDLGKIESYSQAPESSSASYVYGKVYLTDVKTADGEHTVKALCMMV